MLQVKPFHESPGFCGAASLKMVLSYYGIERTEEELGRLMGCPPEGGVAAEKIVDAATSFGCNAQIIDNASFEDIERLVLQDKIPVIVDWFSEDDGHYSVVVDIDKENIYLMDPQVGHVRALPRETFFRIWFDFPGLYIESNDQLILRRLIIITKKS